MSPIRSIKRIAPMQSETARRLSEKNRFDRCWRDPGVVAGPRAFCTGKVAVPESRRE
jgi:hypothetical protein